MARSINTLLLVTQDVIVRAELRAGQVVDLAEEPRPAVGDLPSLVEAALRLSRRRPGRVWLLTSDCWIQTMGLPSDAVARLKPEEVGRALAFEAEPFSGLGAMEAAVGHMPLPGGGDHRQYWLIALNSYQLQEVEDVIQHAGGRLAAISHPAGLSCPLAIAGGTLDWQRVELWPSAVVRVRATADGGRDVLVRNADPRPGRWEEEVQRWRDEAPGLPFEGLHATGAVPRGDLSPDTWVSLGEESGLRILLEAWARQIQSGEPALPVLHPPRRPMSASTRGAIAAGLAAAVLALCLGHYFLIESQRNSLAALTQQLRQPAQQLAELKKETEKTQKTATELRTACDTLAADLALCRRLLQQQRHRLAAMLGVLAERCPEELLIQRIEGGDQGVLLQGVCLQPELVNGLAANLATKLSPLGWLVNPPGKHSLDQLDNGGPWSFEIQMQEAPVEAAPQPVVPDPKHRTKSRVNQET